MWFFFGIAIAGVLIAVYGWALFPWPFDESKFRKPGEPRLEWEKRVEAQRLAEKTR